MPKHNLKLYRLSSVTSAACWSDEVKTDVQPLDPSVHACIDKNRHGCKTHREQELLDLLHGVRHAQVGVRDGRKHLDEHVQLHGEVGVFGFPAFPQTLLLRKRQTGVTLYSLIRQSFNICFISRTSGGGV